MVEIRLESIGHFLHSNISIINAMLPYNSTTTDTYSIFIFLFGEAFSHVA